MKQYLILPANNNTIKVIEITINEDSQYVTTFEVSMSVEEFQALLYTSRDKIINAIESRILTYGE